MDGWMDGWMDGQVWMGMALQMDLYGTEVEMAEPSETQGWMGHLRKVRVEVDRPHQAEGSKHAHDGDFFQAVCRLRLILFHLYYQNIRESGNLGT